MQTYKFKLENLLQLKEKIEEDKKNQLGIAVKNFQEQKQILDYLKGEASNSTQQFTSEIVGGVYAWQAKNYGQYMITMSQRINRQHNNVNMVEKKVEQCRTSLIKATIEKKSFEKLKQQDKEDYNCSLNKEEQQFIDQLTSYAYANRIAKTGGNDVEE